MPRWIDLCGDRQLCFLTGLQLPGFQLACKGHRIEPLGHGAMAGRQDAKNKTGNHIDVYNYVVESEESKKFYKMLFDMLVYLIPEYEEEGKAHLRIGIGCSGGQHRSVSYVNKLHKELSEEFDYKITYYHREVGEKEIV